MYMFFTDAQKVCMFTGYFSALRADDFVTFSVFYFYFTVYIVNHCILKITVYIKDREYLLFHFL